MRSLLRHAGVALGAFVALSCSTSDRVTAPELVARASSANIGTGDVVISQIYGGGGNSGATLKNDFVELHNTTSVPVNVGGWSVQYASAAGTTWQVTGLTGTIPAGGYYLVQEAAGSGGTVNLPTPNASGSIAMSATDGKVALLKNSTVALSGACPGGNLADLVSFGTGNCGNAAPKLSNTTAALRGDKGCTNTGNPTSDFVAGAPAPRNLASPIYPCGPAGPLHHVTVSGPATVTIGTPVTFTATPEDAFNKPISGLTITWSSGNTAVATVDATGLVSGVTASATPVAISASATENSVTKTGIANTTIVNPEIHWLDVGMTSASLPPGFQTNLLLTARVAQNGTVVPATFTYEALDPDIATVSSDGTVTGVASSASKPRFKLTATPVGGGTTYTFTTGGSTSPTIEPAVSAPLSIYGTNDELGRPTAAGASDPNDFLISRAQYMVSYNQSRGTPNWVSYEMDVRQDGSQNRCNCFTADPNLPAAKQIFWSNYTNSGFDRGHMTRSADRDAAIVDNAMTYYMTNIVPQTPDLNQGVWAKFEDRIADSSDIGGRAVYVITGPIYSRPLTFVKNEGKVAIPDSTWKIAIIGPRSGGLPFTRANLGSWDALEGITVIAVNMPNIAGVRNDSSLNYRTTIDKLEASTGFDFLSLLPVAFQTALEAGDHAPKASFTVGANRFEGSPVSFNASASTDPDLGRTDMDHAEALSYSWTFGDGGTGTGVNPSHTYANDGTFTVTVTVTDAWGWEKTSTQTVTVANVAPMVNGFAGATLLPGETYAATGSFTDPGDDSWSATVDYGFGAAPLALDGQTFALSHTYTAAGTYTVVVTVSDDDATRSNQATVTVITPEQMIANVRGTITDNSLRVKLDAATRALARDGATAAANQLEAFLNEVEAMERTGRLSATTAAAWRVSIGRVITSITR